MSTEDGPKSAKASKEEFDIIQNRIQLALAKRENLVKSWTASSSRKEPTKTQEELDAEDAALFRNEPPYLGVGAAIPPHFLVSDAERNNKSLRAKFFPNKGLKGSKPRDSEEKAASAKRTLNEESSEDEGGRSSLGKAKKFKFTKVTNVTPAPVEELEAKANAHDDEIETKETIIGKLGGTKDKAESSLATPPTTPEKNKNESVNQDNAKKIIDEAEEPRRPTYQAKVPQIQEEQKAQKVTPRKPMNNKKQLKLQEKREKQKLKRKTAKNHMEKELIAKLAIETPEWLD